jgi:nucleoside-diphosphate kinase
MVWEGKNAVVTGRKMLGATNPADSAPGTIRGDFAIETGLCSILEEIEVYE